MADVTGQFEALETALMRAWMHGDGKEAKRLITGDFVFMIGTRPVQLLDRASWTDAMGTRLRCNGYRIGEVIARKYGKTVWFTFGAELELQVGREDWKGHFLITDLWRKGFGRKWRLAERSMARVDTNEDFSREVHRLQLWN